jgi:hypothetical protein
MQNRPQRNAATTCTIVNSSFSKKQFGGVTVGNGGREPPPSPLRVSAASTPPQPRPAPPPALAERPTLNSRSPWTGRRGLITRSPADSARLDESE